MKRLYRLHVVAIALNCFAALAAAYMFFSPEFRVTPDRNNSRINEISAVLTNESPREASIPGREHGSNLTILFVRLG
jgi:hypothetical protein